MVKSQPAIHHRIIITVLSLSYPFEPQNPQCFHIYPNEMNSVDVKTKAAAATQWCQYATEHEGKNGGKPWTYLLIPHDAISENKTLKGLAATYIYRDASNG